MQEISEILEVNALLVGLSEASTKKDLLTACARARRFYPALRELDAKRTKAEILEQIHGALVEPLEKGGRLPSTEAGRASELVGRSLRSSDADREYLRALRILQVGSGESGHEAAERLGRTQRAVLSEAYGRLARAYDNYADSWRRSCGQENAEGRAGHAYYAYLRACVEEQADVQRKLARSWRELAQALRAAWEKERSNELDARRDWMQAKRRQYKSARRRRNTEGEGSARAVGPRGMTEDRE